MVNWNLSISISEKSLNDIVKKEDICSIDDQHNNDLNIGKSSENITHDNNKII